MISTLNTWNLPPGCTLADIEGFAAEPEPPPAYPLWAERHPDAAAKLEAEFARDQPELLADVVAAHLAADGSFARDAAGGSALVYARKLVAFYRERWEDGRLPR